MDPNPLKTRMTDASYWNLYSVNLQTITAQVKFIIYRLEPSFP